MNETGGERRCHPPTSSFDELALRVSSAIADVHDLFVGSDYIRLEFSESEFSVRLGEVGHRQERTVRFTAVVRAAFPSGGTWWAEWSVSCYPDALATMIAEEVVSRRRYYRRMLAENAHLSV